MLRIGLAAEPDAVLVHDGPGMRLPSSSTPLGRRILRRSVASALQDLRAEALQPLAELALELASVVREDVVRDPEGDQPSPVEDTKDLVWPLAAHRCNQLVAR